MLRRQKASSRAGLAGRGIVSGGPRRADDVKRQHVNGQRSLHGSATFKGTATPPLMSHKVMFVLLGECVGGCLAVCGGEHPVRVILCVHVRVCDGQQADIKCQRSSVAANPLWQVFLPGPAATVTDPSLYIPKMASRVSERGHRRAGRCRQRCRIGCNRAISHLIPFICSSAGREVANLIWPIVLSAAVYLQF